MSTDAGELDDETADEPLEARLELLSEENRRLREEYRRAKRAGYRRSAIALAVLGGLAALGAALFPGVREVLLALSGVGLFSGALVYYLTPERLVPASVAELTYDTYQRTLSGVVDDLGLKHVAVYVPTGGVPAVRLFVPSHREYEIPDSDDLADVFVVDDATRGVSLYATGAELYDEFVRADTTASANDPRRLVESLAESLVEVFELVESATADVDPQDGRATVAVTGSSLGSVDRLDHPVGSLVATGLAVELSTPVELSVDPAEDDRADYLVTCRWETDD